MNYCTYVKSPEKYEKLLVLYMIWQKQDVGEGLLRFLINIILFTVTTVWVRKKSTSEQM